MSFQPFPKVPRYSRDMVITEKIDGTNASVWILSGQEADERGISLDDNTLMAWASDPMLYLLAGSRKRFITPEDDNFGFAKWVKDYAEDLIKGLGQGVHYGEWWGQGIQRNYGLKEKRFSLFNTKRWDEEHIPACCSVVPTLFEGPFTSYYVNDTMTLLSENGSYAAPGFDNPEGIMIYHTAANQMFKKTFEGDQYGKENAR